MVDRYVRFGRGDVFMNKNTRNARRLGLLDSLLPQSVFVHVLRHPLDTVSSLISVGWWSSLPLWTRDDQTPASFGTDPIQQAALAAELWRAEVTQASASGRRLEPDRYVEIRYESFVTAPDLALLPVMERLRLDPANGNFVAALKRVRQSSVGTWRRRLDSDQCEAAWNIAGALASSLGYVV
jgi:hypothetical protein